MKTNSIYKLNKNLDLKNENFLVKKGTYVMVLEKFNEIDKDKPTVLSLKFKNIIGEYQFEEKELEKQFSNNTFKIINTKFKINENVKTDDFGSECGKIVEIKPDEISGHRYVVVFLEKRYTFLEEQLSRCL